MKATPSDEDFLARLDELGADGPPSPHENVQNALAELLYAADVTRDVLGKEHARDYRWIEPRIQRIYDTVNGIMKKLGG